MVSNTVFVMISIHNPIGNDMPYSMLCYNPLIEHLLEPVCYGFTVHWMVAQLLILHLVLALIGFGMGSITFLPSCFAHSVLMHSVCTLSSVILPLL